ncbi:hypothetical protein JCM12856_32580 [Spirochaeta dissipatitropha]
MEPIIQAIYVCDTPFYTVIDDENSDYSFIDNYNTNTFKTIFKGFEQEICKKILTHENATLMRLLSGHLQETLFAFLFALLQAPHAIIAWLTLYKNQDIDMLLDHINNKKDFKYFKFKIDRVCWDSISEFLHPINRDDNVNKSIKYLSKFLRVLSAEYLDDRRRSEYNSIKHGLKILNGGFKMQIGRANKKLTISGLHGSMFYTKNKCNFNSIIFHKINRTSINWNVQEIYNRSMICMNIIDNILNVFKFFHEGDNTKFLYYIFDHSDNAKFFNDEQESSVISINRKIDPAIVSECINEIDIEKFYEEKLVII